jgi:hypothetical protein
VLGGGGAPTVVLPARSKRAIFLYELCGHASIFSKVTLAVFHMYIMYMTSASKRNKTLEKIT